MALVEVYGGQRSLAFELTTAILYGNTNNSVCLVPWQLWTIIWNCHFYIVSSLPNLPLLLTSKMAAKALNQNNTPHGRLLKSEQEPGTVMLKYDEDSLRPLPELESQAPRDVAFLLSSDL